ncbi:MAG: sulfatase-like hydrolase/transferase [Candidatus Aminicenantes bacterium]|nr:sulfatase-like hydrolase/transferase [Candidatus Aminicenantes bacterium]
MTKRKKRRKKRVRLGQEQKFEVQKDFHVNFPSQGTKKFNFPFYRLIIPSILIISISIFLWRFFIFNPVKKDSSFNVLLITLDTTRADRLGCYGYKQAETPNIDNIARKGVIFTQAYAQVPLTFPSHCCLFTGTYPLYHGARNNGTYYLSSDIITLAEILKAKGLITAAFVSSFTVDSRFGLNQGFDYYDDQFRKGETFKGLNAERRAEEVFISFKTWFEQNYFRPFFIWVHFFDPHLPYDPPSPYKEKFIANPYDGEIAYMDFYVGKIIEALETKNLLDKTLVILVGDHGEAFGEKGEDGHGIFLYEETLKVPLIFLAKNRLPSGQVIKTRARLIDLMPTILDFLQLPSPQQIHGVSLLPLFKKHKLKDFPNYIETYFPRENFGWSELIGLMKGPWKYIKAPREELYNLKTDPGEKINLAKDNQRMILKLREELNHYLKNYSSSLAQKRQLSLEEREKLRALGYLSSIETDSTSDYPDPKDKIEELRLITQAELLEWEQKFDEAVKIYEKILTINPKIPTSYINLGLNYLRLGQPQQALAIFQKGLALMPGSLLLLSRLGHTYLALGQIKNSLETWQSVLALDPENFDALVSIAWIYSLLGEKETARKYYEAALSIEPENKFVRKNLAHNLATSGFLERAVAIFESLIQEFPDDYEIWQDLGIAYGHLNNLDKAVECLEKAVNLKPTPTAYYNLGVAYKKKGELAEAIKYLRLYLDKAAGENEEKIRSVRYEIKWLSQQIKNKK